VNILGIGKLKKEKRKKHINTNILFSGSIYRMMCCKHSGCRALLRIYRALLWKNKGVLRIYRALLWINKGVLRIYRALLWKNKGVLRIYIALLGICRAVRINRLLLWDIDGSFHDNIYINRALLWINQAL